MFSNFVKSNTFIWQLLSFNAPFVIFEVNLFLARAQLSLKPSFVYNFPPNSGPREGVLYPLPEVVRYPHFEVPYPISNGDNNSQARQWQLSDPSVTYIVGCRGASQLGGLFQGNPPRVLSEGSYSAKRCQQSFKTFASKLPRRTSKQIVCQCCKIRQSGQNYLTLSCVHKMRVKNIQCNTIQKVVRLIS